MESLYQHYRDILHNPDLRYYQDQNWNIDPEDSLTPQGAHTFISSFIDAGNKLTDEICQLIGNLSSPRSHHIVSTYLLGITLYQIPHIQQYINKQLERLTTNDDLARRFLYVWFLLCFFHDLGYAYELGRDTSVESYKSPTIYKRNNKYAMLPHIYNTCLVRNYKRYRQRCMCVIDHGIIGGQVMYEELITHLRPRPDIVRVLKVISSIIMVHNIFFQKGKSHCAQCYRYYHLDSLLYMGRKCRKISLADNPLLFLFDLVDSIEPLKSTSVENLDSIRIECNRELVVEIPNTHKYAKFRKRLKDMNLWLTDVRKLSDDKFMVVL